MNATTLLMNFVAAPKAFGVSLLHLNPREVGADSRRLLRFKGSTHQSPLLATLLLCVFALMPLGVRAATNELSSALQTGLFEEEANRNLPAAIAAYEKVAKQFDQNRALAATAIFRLGEVNRKLGKTNEAAAFYQRILREFTDQDTLVKLSQQNLAGMGVLPRTAPTTSETSSANSTALNAAEAEAAKLETEVNLLGGLGREELQSFVQHNCPNPILSKLLQDLATAEQAHVTLSRDFETTHPNMRSSTELIKTIKKQISDQLDGVIISMQVMRNAAQATAKALREKAGQNTMTQPSKSGVSAPITAVLDEEEAEIRRIQAMIQNSPDLINASGESGGYTPLHKAALAGQLRVVRFLLDNGASINLRNNAKETPLTLAAFQGHRAMVELLLSRGSDVNAKGGAGYTALHQATLKGFRSVAEALLANKANINARSEDLETPLHMAAQAGHPELASFLIAKGADVDAAGSAGLTPLFMAASAGHADVLGRLLDAKAKTDIEGNQGRTALSYAAEKGHAEIVNALLAAKADPNAGKVNLPLHCAIKSKSAGIVEVLLKAGADANRVCTVTWRVNDSSSNTPEITPLALASYGQLDMVKLLLAHKADPNGKRVDGLPLIFAAVNDAELMKAFLDAGAKPNVDDGKTTDQRHSPLLAAGNPQVVTLLLAAKANPETRHRNLCDNSDLGMTPLLLWTSCWSLPDVTGMVEALLKGGANVNARTEDGRTALNFAALRKNKELMQLLITYKADVNARDNQGLTPLDYAEGKNQPRASQFISSGTLLLPVAGAPVASARVSSQPQSKTETGNVADLLRSHGGLADLPKLDRIEVTRPSSGYRATAFMAGTNGWNQFTLAEVLAQQLGLISSAPRGEWSRSVQPRLNRWGQSPIRFPDWSRITIHRSTADSQRRIQIPARFSPSPDAHGVRTDTVLQPGDEVEIPEADHPVSDSWLGPTAKELESWTNALARAVKLVVAGQPAQLRLTSKVEIFTQSDPEKVIIAPASFMLRSVLDESKLIRSSSDLTRVKVTRRESANDKPREWILDCSIPDKAPDLWLRDGDVIEVPEK